MWSIESITLLGVIITLLLFVFETASKNKMQKQNFFADYTKRYQKIMLHLPEGLHHSNFDYGQLNAEERDKILRYIRAYFDLCSEEYDLHLQKLINKKVWENWKEGMKSVFSKQAFREAWNMIALDSSYYKDFVHFVNSTLLPGIES